MLQGSRRQTTVTITTSAQPQVQIPMLLNVAASSCKLGGTAHSMTRKTRFPPKPLHPGTARKPTASGAVLGTGHWPRRWTACVRVTGVLVDTIKAWPALLLTPWLDKSEPLASLPQVSLGPASSDPTALGVHKKSHISRDVNHASQGQNHVCPCPSFLHI